MQVNRKSRKRKQKLQLATPNAKFYTKDSLRYRAKKVSFAIADINKDGLVKECTDFTYCREILLDQVRAQISGAEILEDTRKDDTIYFSTNQTRVLFLEQFNISVGLVKKFQELRTAAYKRLEIGVNLTNIFAKRAGWDLTVMEEVVSCYKDINVCNPHIFLYVNGDSKWVSSPYMLSLFVLLLRCGSQSRFKHTKTLSAFLALVDNKINYKHNHRSDIEYINSVGVALPTLFDNFDHIFEGRTTKTNYDSTHHSKDAAPLDVLDDEGIDNLICRPDDCADVIIKNKLHILLEKELGEKK